MTMTRFLCPWCILDTTVLSSAIIRSISRFYDRCSPWVVSGGKSGSAFFRTCDERFILKQMSKYEANSFEPFMVHYFEYVQEAVRTARPSCLAKILGIYKVSKFLL